MLSYLLYNSIIITLCIQKGVNLVYMVDQTNTFQVYNVSATLKHFHFDQQSKKDSPSIPENKAFFYWLEYYWR